MSIEHKHRQAQTAAFLLQRTVRQPRGWRLWTVPRPLIAYLLAIEAFTLAVTAVAAHPAAVTRDQVWRFLVLVGLGVVVAELTRQVERLRRRFADTPHVNMSSVWTLPAALLLPPVVAAATVVTLYLHLWLRSWYRVRGVHLYRLTFSTCTVILASYAAGTTLQNLAPLALSTLNTPRSLLTLLAAVLAYSAGEETSVLNTVTGWAAASIARSVSVSKLVVSTARSIRDRASSASARWLAFGSRPSSTASSSNQVTPAKALCTI